MKRLFQASAAAAAVLLCASAPEAEPFEEGARTIVIKPAEPQKQTGRPPADAAGEQSRQPLRTGRELRVDPAPPPALERQRTAEGLGLRPAPAPEFAGGRPQERPEPGLAERSSLEELRRHGAAGEYGGGDAPRTDADRRLAEEVRREEAARARKERERREMRALRDELLDESIERLLPLEPDEIRSYRRRRDSVEGAATPSPARMRTQSRQISAVPGAAPQVIRVTGGYSSTVMFQDATGAPWPVLSVVLGDPRSFAVSQPRVTQETLYSDVASGTSATAASNRGKMEAGTSNVTSNIVNIVPLTNHSSSNLVVTLEGLPYPVVLHLLSESTALEERAADALVVFRLDKSGPQAKAPVVGPAIPGAVTEDVLSFVHGVAPKGADRLKPAPDVPGVQMWRMDGMLYLRTMHQPVWPAWTASAAGDGVSVYVMPDSPSVVVSIGGKRVKMSISRQDD